MIRGRSKSPFSKEPRGKNEQVDETEIEFQTSKMDSCAKAEMYLEMMKRQGGGGWWRLAVVHILYATMEELVKIRKILEERQSE